MAKRKGKRRRRSVNQGEELWVTTYLNLTLPLFNAALLQMRGMKRDNKKRQCIFEQNKKGKEVECAVGNIRGKKKRWCCFSREILLYPLFTVKMVFVVATISCECRGLLWLCGLMIRMKNNYCVYMYDRLKNSHYFTEYNCFSLLTNVIVFCAIFMTTWCGSWIIFLMYDDQADIFSIFKLK